MINKIIKSLKLFAILGILGFFLNKSFFYFFFSYWLAIGLSIVRNLLKKGSKDMFLYYLTLYCAVLNPFNFLNGIKQVTGQIYSGLVFFFIDKSRAHTPSKFEYMLPFQDAWTVARGGVTKETSHSWSILSQRYAYDFCIYNELGSPFKTSGKFLDDYYCYSQPILSPENGIVVEVKDTIKDYQTVGNLSIDWKTKDFRGNFVVIKHSDEEYSFIAHLKHKSILVKVGDNVNKGQKIALCGNSGHSTMPHIHFQIQNKKSFWFAMGIPIRFKNIKIETPGNSVVNTTMISGNEVVSNLNIDYERHSAHTSLK